MGAWSKSGLDRLDKLVARHVAVDGVRGAAWLVARTGEVHVGTAGSLDGSRPVQRDSIVRIASMTKPFTAVAALAMAEDGVLRLDDQLDQWIPELADRQVLADPGGDLEDTVPAVRQPTTHDALTFRLGRGIDFANWAARPAFESGAGGLVSTLDDYLTFAQALLDGRDPISLDRRWRR